MRYLLDTNVLSELRKKHPNHEVLKWISENKSKELCVSCLTIGEIRHGVLKKSKQDKVAGASLLKWLESLLEEYNDRILGIDLEVCEEWARLLAIDSTNGIDSLIAAQAIATNCTMVTRNIKYFTKFGVKLLNPFDE